MKALTQGAAVMLALLTAAVPVRAVSPIIGVNFQGSTFSESSYFPPDSMGAAGVDHFVELVNGRFIVYDKSTGGRKVTKSLNQFWSDAGAAPTSYAFDPRILYDPYSARWFAVSVDNARAVNHYLVAVSASSDPTGAWHGFRVDSDPAGALWADFPTLGLNAQGVYVAANMFGISSGAETANLLILPKEDLLLPVPSIARRTLIQDVIGSLDLAPQPVVSLDNAASAQPVLAYHDARQDRIRRANLLSPITAPTLGATTSITVSNISTPPDADQPGTKPNLDTGDARLGSSVIQRGNEMWAVQGVNSGGRAAVRWFRLNASDNSVIQSGTIADPNLAFFFPSIAVNPYGEAVIAFSGSAESQAPSSYAVAGTTSGGSMSFGTPILLQAGNGDYRVLDGSDRNRWGDYSATTLDPADPSIFWTIQEIVAGTDNWATQTTQIILPRPGEVRWRQNVGGPFATGANWFGAAPPGAGDHAVFSIAAAQTVQLTGHVANQQLSVRQGQVTLDLGGATYQLTSGAAPSVLVGEFAGAPTLTITNGSLSCVDAVIAPSAISTGALVVQGAAASLNATGSLHVGGSSAGPGGQATLTVATGASLNIGAALRVYPHGAVNLEQGALVAASLDLAGGKLSVSPGAGAVVRTGALAIANDGAPLGSRAYTGRLDLSDSDLIVDYAPAGPSPLAELTDMLRAGFNAPSGGGGGGGLRWDGHGITSSAARDFAARTTTLGVIDNVDPDGAGPLSPRLPLGGSFDGVTVDDSMVVVKYTSFGDVNFDGMVDAADYALIDNGFNFQGSDPALRNWASGDMNFDGAIDAADYALIDNAFNFQSGALAWGLSPDAATAALRGTDPLSSPVPEPGAAVAILVLLAAALPRRRRGRPRAPGRAPQVHAVLS